jgi:hypothetical protein
MGDSHSNRGWSGVVNIALGPLLCYTFGIQKPRICDHVPFKDGDTIIFCLGEIDCRCHIHKFITSEVTYQMIIDNIVSNYMDSIELNTTDISFKRICVYNVVPPIQRYNTAYENPEYPYLGTDDERKQYVLYFNKKIKEKCAEKKYMFFDVYDKYIDSNGFLRKDLSDDNVHIQDGRYIREFMEENF